ncbi:glycosyltransferase [Domibacillus sp. A3M-37]|uniref:glycosyltransferase n=1 Tax=Domibacillus sp. A3M-37 TaxID=2962037 RepID=UPI0020B6B791|nr:glycosyltransferase [Domibacillus sp. A3M-37]MCP3761433.1 glycosyltransferase [Domibacillus sp. A3M-37]
MKRILLAANMYPNTQFPSYGVFVQNTERILTNGGFQVDRVVLEKKTSKAAKAIGYAAYYSNLLRKGLSGHYDAIYVHYASHNALPLLMLKRMKPSVRIVTNVHGSDVVPEVPSQEKYQPYVKQLLEQSSLIITPSHYYESLVKEKYGVHTPIAVFPSGGVNKAVFHPKEKAQAIKELELDPSCRYIGYVGRLDVGKGWDHYVRAIKLYNDANPGHKTKFIAVGAGKDEAAFKQLVTELGLEDVLIHYGLMQQSGLANVYNAIDAFVFPTTRKGESLGLVGLEAMACRTPIIASAIGGILDYVQPGENSWLFEPGNAEALKDQLIAFDQLSQAERDAVAEAAYQTAMEYEESAIQPKLISIFNEL